MPPDCDDSAARALDVVGGAERGAEIGRGIVEAVDVRPHQADVVLLADLDDLGLQFRRAGFGKARGNQNGAGDLLLAAFDQRAGDEFCGDREHRGVDHARHVLDALVGLVAQDLGRLRVDRIDLALVAAVDQVLHHRVADLAVFGRSADHGNRLRLHDAVHRGDDFLGRARRRTRLVIEVDDDAHVGGDRVLLGGEYRVEIEFDDFGEVADELRHLDDDVGQRIAADRVAAAHALQHVMGLNAVEHRQGIVLGGGGEPEGDVLQDLDQHAAEAEGHQLAERAVGDGADDDLGAAGQHLLDLDALDLGVGLVFPGIGQNGLVILLDVGRRLHAHHHAAGLGLVQDVRRDDLHHHREAHIGGDLGGLGGGFGHAFLRNGNAVGVAYQLAFRCRQTRAFVRLD